MGVGTTSPTEKLQVEGNVLINNGSLIIKGNNSSTPNTNEIVLKSNGYIRAREIQVDLNYIPHPDYVFKKDYNLMPLKELKEFVEANKHLPNIKSEKEVKEEGSYALGEMNLKLLEKVEELTLYIIDLEERISKVELKEGKR